MKIMKNEFNDKIRSYLLTSVVIYLAQAIMILNYYYGDSFLLRTVPLSVNAAMLGVSVRMYLALKESKKASDKDNCVDNSDGTES